MRRAFRKILDKFEYSIMWIIKGFVVGISLSIIVKYLVYNEQPSNYYIFLIMLNLASIIIQEIRDNGGK